VAEDRDLPRIIDEPGRQLWPVRELSYPLSVGDSITIQAPAKLNLALAVGPPDCEGMHPICSWMVTIDLCDELEITRLAPDRTSRYAILWHDDAKRRCDIDWSMTRDLAVRAHLALEQHAERRLPIQMKLSKRIPVGGGLGGGSSNAASCLRGVNRLFGLGLSDDELCDVAAGLGSDVPFFVTGGSAVVEGFGERIERLAACPDLHAVVVFPPESCPTGHVYAAFDDRPAGALRSRAVRALAEAPGPPAPEAVFNDLADAAVRLVPALGEHIARLRELAEGPVHVAGSGSSLFVICADELHGSHLAGAVEQRLGLPAVAVRATTGHDGPESPLP
jgi:4-diphosphocytidyl-2-C-methyl-D-erythritol kinase